LCWQSLWWFWNLFQPKSGMVPVLELSVGQFLPHTFGRIIIQKLEANNYAVDKTFFKHISN
jgi:hypothetical protein